MSASELDNIYETLQKKYKDLSSAAAEETSRTKRVRELWHLRKKAEEEARYEKRIATRDMGFLTSLKASLSSNPSYGDAHGRALKRIEDLRAESIHLSQRPEDPRVAERKQIYHQLEVLREIRRENNQVRIRSLADARMGEIRSTSSSLKARETKKSGPSSDCPYCGVTCCTEDMALDHIYPVAAGGLGTPRNTVLVCASCNSKKSDLTLRRFCVRMGFDFETVCSNLDALGKDF